MKTEKVIKFFKYVWENKKSISIFILIAGLIIFGMIQSCRVRHLTKTGIGIERLENEWN